MRIKKKGTPESKAEPRKKRRWLAYLDLIIVFMIFNIVLLLIFLLPRTHVASSSGTAPQKKQGSQTSLAIPAIPHNTQNVNTPQSSTDNPACTNAEHLDGSCLEGVFNDDGDTYKNAKRDPQYQSPVLNPISDSSALFFYTPYKYTVDNTQVRELWKGILIIVDAFIVLVLMLNGIRVIFSGIVFRFDKAVEELPGIFLAIIAAHLSITFVMAFLGLNNILVYDTYQWSSTYIFQSDGVATSEGKNPYTVNIVIGAGLHNTPEYDNLPDSLKKDCPYTDFWDEQVTEFFKSHHWFGTYYCKNLPTDAIVRSIMIQKDLNFTDLFDNLQDLSNGLKIILKVMALMLMAQMIIRLFFIIFYIVTAPLGLACWALPGKVGQSVTNLWLKGFISTVMVQFVMVVALIVMQMMAGAILHFVATPLTTSDRMDYGPGQLDVFTLLKLMCLCFFWFLIRIPSLLGTAPMRTMTMAGQAMAQAVSATIAIQIAEAQFVMQSVSSGVSIAAAAR